MKLNFKKLVSLVLVLAISFAIAVPAFAAVKDSGSNISNNNSNDSLTVKDSGKIIYPQSQMIVKEFVRYDSKRNIVNKTKYYLGVASTDNRGSSSPCDLTFKATSSSSVTGTISASFTEGVEMDAVFANIEASTTYTAALSVSWSSGQEMGTSITVPAYKQGEIRAYIPAVSTSGSKVYWQYDAQYQTYDQGHYSYQTVNAWAPISNWVNTVNRIF
jgi:hypothetical protein